MNVAGFNELSPFYDDRACPMGFSRSGHFTLQQAQIIERYGRQLIALEQGETQPETPEQSHFVEVCQGKMQPETLLEKSWAQYYKLRFNTCAVNPFGKVCANADEDDLAPSSDDDL